MKKALIILTAALTAASLFSCEAADSSSDKAASATESSAVISLPSIDRAEIAAEYTEGTDGYLFRLDVEGDLKYWIAEVTMTDCGEKSTFKVSTRDYDRNSRYIIGGSTITDISAVITPFDKDGNAGKPLTVKWDPERIEKNTSEYTDEAT